MDQNVKDLIYLLFCAANGAAPDEKRVQGMDLDTLFQISKAHSLSAAVHTALDRAGVRDARFYDAFNKSLRRNILHDAERQALSKELERAGIWYLPLKGCLLKDLYPVQGMREMADNDILYDSSRQNDLREIMLRRGFEAESVGETHHDVYIRKPLLNFEMHTALIEEMDNAPALLSYYADPERLLKPDGDGKYGRHLSDEDFYLYVTAHEYKHYISSGTGLRNLLDRYIFIRKKGRTADWNYITEQLREMKMRGFECRSRRLAKKLFSSAEFPALTEKETEMFLYYLDSSTYGNVRHYAENAVKRHYSAGKHSSRISYILKQLFPDAALMKPNYPFLARRRILLPAAYALRGIKVLFFKRERIKAEITALRHYRKG